MPEDSEAPTEYAEHQQLRQGMSEWESERYGEKLQLYYQQRENASKYTQFIREERASRLQKKRDQILQHRVDAMEEKIRGAQQSTQPIVLAQDGKKGAADSDEEGGDPKRNAPLDYEFQFGMMDTAIAEPGLALPPNQDGLFVTRPIDKYEPVPDEKKRPFAPDPLQPMKKRFPAQP